MRLCSLRKKLWHYVIPILIRTLANYAQLWIEFIGSGKGGVGNVVCVDILNVTHPVSRLMPINVQVYAVLVYHAIHSACCTTHNANDNIFSLLIRTM